jgi:hypothetical protein
MTAASIDGAHLPAFFSIRPSDRIGTEDHSMATAEKRSSISPEIMAELQRAADDAAKGIRDPEKMRKACQRMDKTREQIRQRIGIVDFAVPTIRALRDGGDE